MWRFTQPRALLLLSPPALLSLSSYLRLTSLPPLSAPGVGISWFKMHMISGLDEISVWKTNRINFCNIGDSYLNYKSVYIQGYRISRSIKSALNISDQVQIL